MSEWNPPLDDIELANQRHLRFKVACREKRGQRWIVVRDEILSLSTAFATASEAEFSEVSLWVKRQDGNGNLLYWASERPELFNSVVLQEGYS